MKQTRRLWRNWSNYPQITYNITATNKAKQRHIYIYIYIYIECTRHWYYVCEDICRINHLYCVLIKWNCLSSFAKYNYNLVHWKWLISHQISIHCNVIWPWWRIIGSGRTLSSARQPTRVWNNDDLFSSDIDMLYVFIWGSSDTFFSLTFSALGLVVSKLLVYHAHLSKPRCLLLRLPKLNHCRQMIRDLSCRFSRVLIRMKDHNKIPGIFVHMHYSKILLIFHQHPV